MFFNRQVSEVEGSSRFLVSVEKDENIVRASCPDFPGCMVEANSVDDALEQLRKLIMSHLDAIREDLAEIVGFE